MKRKILFYAALAAALLALYSLTRYEMNIVTAQWAAKNIFWYVAALIFISAVFNKVLFSASIFAGYFLGIVAGELLGNFGQTYYGWIILLILLITFCALGVLGEIYLMPKLRAKFTQTDKEE